MSDGSHLSESELQDLERLLVGFHGDNNEDRVEAERRIVKLMDEQPQVLVHGLLRMLELSSIGNVQALSVVLLRRMLPNGEPIVYDVLEEHMQAEVKRALIECLYGHPDEYVRALLVDTVGELASTLLYRDDGWPGFVDNVLAAVDPTNAVTCVLSLELLRKLCKGCIDPITEHHIRAVLDAYTTCIDEKVPALKVRVAAARASCTAVTYCLNTNNPDEYARAAGYLSGVFGVLLACLPHIEGDFQQQTQDGMSVGDCEDLAEKLLHDLVDMATEDENVFTEAVDNVARVCQRLGSSPHVSQNVRHLAMEVMVAMAEKNAVLVRKHDEFLQTAFAMAMSFMLFVEEEEGWAERPSIDERSGEENTDVDCAEVSLGRLAVAIGGIKTEKHVFALITQYLSAPQWQSQYAALQTLTQVGAEIPLECILGCIREVVNMCEPKSSDRHPYVHYAAIFCVGQLSTDFAKELNEPLHDTVVPWLIKYIDHDVPRIQAIAASAIFNFVEPCLGPLAEECVFPYAKTLLDACTFLLEHGHVVAQEQALTLVAALAAILPEGEFLQYYEKFMPRMLAILTEAVDAKYDRLRSKAVEAATYVGMAVGESVFNEDAEKVIEVLKTMLNPDIRRRQDDTSETYMLSAWTRLVGIYKRNFLRFLPEILPFVLQAAQQDVSSHPQGGAAKKVRYDAQGNPIESKSSSSSSSSSLLALNTDADAGSCNVVSYSFSLGVSEALERKTIAVSMIMSFAEDLQAAFYPHVGKCFEITIPLMSHSFTRCRSYAIMCQANLLRCVLSAAEEGICGRDEVLQAANLVFTQLILHMASEPDTDMKLNLVGTVNLCVEYLSEGFAETKEVVELLSEHDLDRLVESLMTLLQESSALIEKREHDRANAKFMDDEENARLDKENHKSDSLHIQICDTIESLMRAYGSRFLPVWERMWDVFQGMLEPNRTPDTQKAALFVIDSFIEVLPEACEQFLSAFSNVLIAYSIHLDPRVKQAAAYGLRVMFEILPEAMVNCYVDAAAEKLLEALGAEQARSEEWATATDNVIVAIGALAKRFRPDLWAVWTAALPLQADMGEGPMTYAELVHQVEEENKIVLGGENYALVPAILNAFLEVVNDVDWLGDESLQSTIIHDVIPHLAMLANEHANLAECLHEEKLQFLEAIMEMNN